MTNTLIKDLSDCCMFCGANELSDEHLFGDWWKDYVGERDPRIRQVSHSVSSGLTEKWVHRQGQMKRKGNVLNQKIPCVCKACNNGWMSQIENGMKEAYVKEFRDGAKLETSYRSIAAWATLKHYIIEWTNFSENAKHHSELLSLAPQVVGRWRDFRKELLPPKSLKTFIFRAKFGDPESFQGLWATLSRDGGRNFECHSTSFIYVADLCSISTSIPEIAGSLMALLKEREWSTAEWPPSLKIISKKRIDAPLLECEIIALHNLILKANYRLPYTKAPWFPSQLGFYFPSLTHPS